mgnify:CR=1 FL=1
MKTGKEINNYFTSQDKKSNDIKVEDGDGTASNPYILKLQ